MVSRDEVMAALAAIPGPDGRASLPDSGAASPAGVGTLTPGDSAPAGRGRVRAASSTATSVRPTPSSAFQPAAGPAISSMTSAAMSWPATVARASSSTPMWRTTAAEIATKHAPSTPPR